MRSPARDVSERDHRAKIEAALMARMEECIAQNNKCIQQNIAISAQVVEVLRWTVKPSDVLDEVKKLREEISRSK